MPKTQQDFLEEARREIPEVSVEEVEARRKRGDDFILLDVREKDEVRAGYEAACERIREHNAAQHAS